MPAEIVAIGTELATGQSQDTNSAWLAQRLAEVGIETCFLNVVGDDLEANLDVFRQAVRRSDIILATGGLGPTLDDLTRDVLARLAGVDLVLDEPTLAWLEELFSSRGRTMPQRNRAQAHFPAGSTIIPNAYGTAPGIWMEVPKSAAKGPNGTGSEHPGDAATAVLVAMPGVPSEMKPMFREWVLPRLLARAGSGKAIVHRTLRCFGMTEAGTEERIGDLTRRGRHPLVGITASEGTISLRISARGSSPDEALALIEPDERFIREQLGEVVFGAEEESLESAVARLLAEKGRTLATAESCTGGLVGHLLTNIPGISAHYLGGVVCYSNRLKLDQLSVPPNLLEEHGAVSQPVAEAMAEGCRVRLGADIGIGITGIAGPDGGSANKPVGLVFVSIAYPEGYKTVQMNWAGERQSVKIRSAKAALNLVRLYLLNGPW